MVRERQGLHNWALLIGVNRYEIADDLMYPDRDMQALRDCLQVAGFPAAQVVTLHDQEPGGERRPTAVNIRRELDRLLGTLDTETGRLTRPRAIGPEDLVVIAFSGHGVHLDGKSYFCPTDARLDTPASLISIDDLYARLAAAPARQKLLVVDACRNEPRHRGTRAGFGGAKQLVKTLERPPAGILVLSSCTVGQVSYEDDELKHGVFTNYLVEGLNGAADADGDGGVTLLALYAYAARRTEDYVSRVLGGVQRPMLKGELSGDFEIGSRHQRYLDMLESGRQDLAAVRYDQAIGAFDAALRLAPRSVDARLGRARAALEISDTATALADCDATIWIRPDVEEAHVIRAAACILESKYDAALAACDQVLKINPRSAAAYEIRSRVNWLRDRYDTALADASKALELDPSDIPAQVVRGFVLRAIGDEATARACARAVKAVFQPRTPLDYYYRARFSELEKNNAAAIGDLDQAIALNPRFGLGYHLRGLLNSNDGHLDRALPDQRKAAELLPRFARAHANLGLTLRNHKEPEAAATEVSRALELDPLDVVALDARGWLAFDRGDYEAALRDFDRIVGDHPDLAYAYRNRGRARKAQGDLDGAIADYDRAITLDPKFAVACVDRGLARKAKGDLDGAIADYGQAITLSPKFAVAYNNRGFARKAKGDLDGALADYGQAITLDPKFAVAYDNRGDARRAQGDLDGAIADYGQAITLDPKFAVAYVDRGDARRAQGDLDGAIADYDQAITLNPKDAEGYNSRGNVYLDKGDHARALADYDRAIALDPKDPLYYENRAIAHERRQDAPRAQADRTMASELRKGAAQQFKAVVTIRNPSISQLETVHYKVRWKHADGTWGDWDKFDLESGYNYWHSCIGGDACQLEFDGVLNDGQYSPTTYTLEFNTIPADREANASDGKPYYFQRKDADHLELYVGIPSSG